MKKLLSLILSVTIVLCMPIMAYAAAPPSAGVEVAITNSSTTPAATTVPGPPALIVVHRVSNLCQVYDANGVLLNTMVVSTGREGHRTPTGNYSIYEHSTGAGYHLMVDGTYGRYCMRFKKGGYMFHSVCYAYNGAPDPLADEVAALGTSVSRGCVRLSVDNAAWLYNATPNGCAVSILDD